MRLGVRDWALRSVVYVQGCGCTIVVFVEPSESMDQVVFVLHRAMEFPGALGVGYVKYGKHPH
jgi:hypothetical protein